MVYPSNFTATHNVCFDISSAPEAARFPANLTLLPHFLPKPDAISLTAPANIASSQENFVPQPEEDSAPLLDIDIDVPTLPPPVVPTHAPSMPSPAQAFRKITGAVRDSFATTQNALNQLRDPIALVNRGVSHMQVVPDSQRDECLDSIAALHDPTPVTTNPIWIDLLAQPNQQVSRVNILGNNPSPPPPDFDPEHQH